jgi:hypothetical protein
MSELLTKISFGVGIFIIFIYVASLLRVIYYEYRINKFFKKIDQETTKIKERPISMWFMKGQIEQVEAKYKPEIEKLERKRRFILEKLPFIKK